MEAIDVLVLIGFAVLIGALLYIGHVIKKIRGEVRKFKRDIRNELDHLKDNEEISSEAHSSLRDKVEEFTEDLVSKLEIIH